MTQSNGLSNFSTRPSISTCKILTLLPLLTMGLIPADGFSLTACPPASTRQSLHPISSLSSTMSSFKLMSPNLHSVDKSRTSTTQLQGIPIAVEVGVGLAAAFAAWLYVDGADDRARKAIREEENARYEAYQAEKARKAYIEPKDFWTLEEIAKYKGYPPGEKEGGEIGDYALDYEGPILLAADGLVFNVWKGRNFYGPGGEYHLFAGRDATRLLAKTIVREETDEEASKPLSIAERAALAGWMFTLKNKYEVVGKLQEFDPSSTVM